MTNQVINKELLSELRLHFGMYIFKGTRFDIVPEELTHSYLFANFHIPQIIKEYYYAPCIDMLTDLDYQNLVDSGYVGKKETTLSPYPFCYKGAYIVRKKLFFQLIHLIHSDDKYKGMPIKKFNDLYPYFDDYSKGFKEGYNSFEEDCIKKYLPMFAEKSDYIDKVFEYVTKEIIFTHSWMNNHTGYCVASNINKNVEGGGEIKKAEEDGKAQGYFYKAWSLLLSNSKLYEELFFKLFSSDKIAKKNSIVDDILNAAYTMQENKLFWDVDEDNRTRQLLDLLHKDYYTKDQARYGESTIGKRAGSVDGVITINDKEFFLEAFNLSCLDRGNIKKHVNKIEKNYDSKGLKEKFVIVYYNLKSNTFHNAAEKYKDYITNEHCFVYPRIEDIIEVEVKYTNSRLYKSYHNREGVTVTLYHLLIMFPK